MRSITKVFVGFVACASVLLAALMYLAKPEVTQAELQAIGFLSALAVVSEMLSFVLAREARGSVAFIPYLATVLLVPSWLAVVAVFMVKLVMESVARIDRLKAA